MQLCIIKMLRASNKNSSLPLFLILLLSVVCGCKFTTDLSVKNFCIFNVGKKPRITHHIWQLFRQSNVHMIRFLSTFLCRLVWHHHFGLKSGRPIYTVSCISKKASTAFPSLHFLLFLRWREKLICWCYSAATWCKQKPALIHPFNIQ